MDTEIIVVIQLAKLINKMYFLELKRVASRWNEINNTLIHRKKILAHFSRGKKKSFNTADELFYDTV